MIDLPRSTYYRRAAAMPGDSDASVSDVDAVRDRNASLRAAIAV